MMRPDHEQMLMAIIKAALLILIAIYSFKLGRVFYDFMQLTLE